MIKERVPLMDILFGMFIPLNLFHLLMFLRKPLYAIFIPLFICLIYAFTNYVKTKKISVLAILTTLIILLNFGSSFLHGHKVSYLFIELLDNLIVGILFLVSLATPRPFALLFIEKETLSKIPEKIQKSPYYMNAWKIITAVWGITYVISALILLCLKLIKYKSIEIIDYIFGWPLLLLLIIFSVSFPYYYWKANWKKIEPQG